jgi:hypothetical protein
VSNHSFKESLSPAAIEMQRRWIVDRNDRMEHERTKCLAKLDGLSLTLNVSIGSCLTHLDERTHLNDPWAAL